MRASERKDLWRTRDGGTLIFIELGPGILVERGKIESVILDAFEGANGSYSEAFKVGMVSGEFFLIEPRNDETVVDFVRTRIFPDGRWS